MKNLLIILFVFLSFDIKCQKYIYYEDFFKEYFYPLSNYENFPRYINENISSIKIFISRNIVNTFPDCKFFKENYDTDSLIMCDTTIDYEFANEIKYKNGKIKDIIEYNFAKNKKMINMYTYIGGEIDSNIFYIKHRGNKILEKNILYYESTFRYRYSVFTGDLKTCVSSEKNWRNRKIKWKFKFARNENHSEILVRSNFENQLTTKYKYDKDYKLIEKHVYAPNDVDERFYYTYDSSGLLIMSKCYNAISNSFNQTFYFYDKDKRINLKISSYNENCIKNNYYYNEIGQLKLQIRKKYSDNNLIEISVLKYCYD